MTFEIRERVTSEGEALVPLDEDQALAVIRRLRELEVEAVCVCFLWSIVNPEHEQRIGELLEAELPGVAYTLSHRLNPIVREYRRASSTAIDASLKPLMQRHLSEMGDDLRAGGILRRAPGRHVVRRRPLDRRRGGATRLLGQLRALDGSGRGQAVRR